MSNRSRQPDVPSYFATPASFLGFWNPFLTGMTQSNEHAAEGIGTLLSEWQHFVSHRLTRDMQLVQRLANCKSPDQIAAAYADFWQKAFADYAKEVTTVNSLIAGATSKAITSFHSASEEAANQASPVRATA